MDDSLSCAMGTHLQSLHDFAKIRLVRWHRHVTLTNEWNLTARLVFGFSITTNAVMKELSQIDPAAISDTIDDDMAAGSRCGRTAFIWIGMVCCAKTHHTLWCIAHVALLILYYSAICTHPEVPHVRLVTSVL